MCVCIINEGQTRLACAATGLTLSSMSAFSVGQLKAYWQQGSEQENEPYVTEVCGACAESLCCCREDVLSQLLINILLRKNWNLCSWVSISDH